MPIITASIDPITRIEGHLKLDVKIDTVNGVQQVVDAFAFGTLFRGFEKILEGRDPRDATIITSRICGVCPTAHSMAAVLTLDGAFGVSGDTPNRTASRLLRNLVHAACFLESHILHFYLLCLPDYIRGPRMAPWLPGWDVGRRVEKAAESRLLANYLEAFTMRRNAHEMGAIYGGKLPHTPAFIAGGFTARANATETNQFRTYLTDLLRFIESKYIPDTELLASLFPEYLELGKGYGNLMAFGAFELDNGTSPALLFRRGLLQKNNPQLQPLSSAQIFEHVRHSWYADTDGNRHPSNGETNPLHPKTGAYSWIKAPRYAGLPCEVGPLARMAVNGAYPNRVSTMDRHMARAREAGVIAKAMLGWLDALASGQSAYTDRPIPGAAMGEGLTEAPRGALGHWLKIENGKIGRYQVITPTCWNVSPRDAKSERGPLEEALIGLPVANADQPIEVMRVMHSFDPCLDCATHVTRVQPGSRIHTTGGWTPAENRPAAGQ